MKYPTIQSRFWSKVNIGNPQECWTWKAYRNKLGYGVFNAGKTALAHRVAYELTNGPIPEGRVLVCHSCDNPPCCNPAHLWLGTDRDNLTDMMNKGRGTKIHGSAHYKAKLTETDIPVIHRLYFEQGMKQADIGKQFGVGRTLIGMIVRGEIWK